MRPMIAVGGLTMLGAIVLSSAPARADFGAIAFDSKTGRTGWSIHAPTPQRAEEEAISACGASDCKVVVKIGPKMCGAVAGIEGKTRIGAASRRDREAARLAALKDCREGNQADCVVKFSDCNR